MYLYELSVVKRTKGKKTLLFTSPSLEEVYVFLNEIIDQQGTLYFKWTKNFFKNSEFFKNVWYKIFQIECNNSVIMMNMFDGETEIEENQTRSFYDSDISGNILHLDCGEIKDSGYQCKNLDIVREAIRQFVENKNISESILTPG